MADLTARRDSWLDYLPGNTQQAINTSPVVNALTRLLSRPSSPSASYQAQREVLGPDIADQQWLEQQAKPPGWLDRLSPTARDNFNTVNTLAMFLGPRAKFADHKALARAQERTAAGVPRESVWREDGWFQGPDGKWRFEIDDKFASWNLPKPEDMVPGKNMQAPVRNALDHPELNKAYPGIGDIPLQYVHIANPDGPLPVGSYRNGPEQLAIRAVPEFADPRSTALHELQHAVQMREDFSRGGNSHRGAAARTYNGIVDRINRMMQDHPGVVMDSPTSQAIESLRSKLRSMPADDAEFYRRLAGEVESRAVQNRMNLTGPERRERPPWLDYDVPENKQIVLD